MLFFFLLLPSLPVPSCHMCYLNFVMYAATHINIIQIIRIRVKRATAKASRYDIVIVYLSARGEFTLDLVHYMAIIRVMVHKYCGVVSVPRPPSWLNIAIMHRVLRAIIHVCKYIQ